MSEELKLKECPFCGSREIGFDPFGSWDGLAVLPDLWYVACVVCGCRTGNMNGKENAAKTWNRRDPLEKALRCEQVNIALLLRYTFEEVRDILCEACKHGVPILPDSGGQHRCNGQTITCNASLWIALNEKSEEKA